MSDYEQEYPTFSHVFVMESWQNDNYVVSTAWMVKFVFNLVLSALFSRLFLSIKLSTVEWIPSCTEISISGQQYLCCVQYSCFSNQGFMVKVFERKETSQINFLKKKKTWFIRILFQKVILWQPHCISFIIYKRDHTICFYFSIYFPNIFFLKEKDY